MSAMASSKAGSIIPASASWSSLKRNVIVKILKPVLWWLVLLILRRLLLWRGLILRLAVPWLLLRCIILAGLQRRVTRLGDCSMLLHALLISRPVQHHHVVGDDFSGVALNAIFLPFPGTQLAFKIGTAALLQILLADFRQLPVHSNA